MESPIEVLDLPTGPVPIRWRRSARARRIGLRVDPADGVVVVTLPRRAGRQAGLSFVHDQARWLAERLGALPEAVPLVEGAVIPLAGEPYCIRHTPGGVGGAWLDGRTLCVSGDAAFLARRVTDFLRAEARRRIGALALVKAAAIEARVAGIRIKDTTTRWGSCAADGTLAFSWRLVMAPPAVQDYVAAHEVAHLRHMHHGPRFWDLVAHLTPHRVMATVWLRQEGPALLRVGRAVPPG